jgi:prepilin-type N-terminal cleavage/methylation domain-containing protein
MEVYMTKKRKFGVANLSLRPNSKCRDSLLPFNFSLFTLQRAFTLIEIMVVITIIGIVMVIAIPNFATMQQRARVRAGAQEVAQDFRHLRERALSGIGNFQVTLPDNRHYQVTHPNGNVSTYQLGQTTGGSLRFGTTVAMAVTPPEASGPIPPSGFDFAGGTLSFESRGSATKGVAYITNNKENFAIGVNRLGKIRVYIHTSGVWQGL